ARGNDARDAVSGVCGDDGFERLDRPVHEIPAAAAVDVHVDVTRRGEHAAGVDGCAIPSRQNVQAIDAADAAVLDIAGAARHELIRQDHRRIGDAERRAITGTFTHAAQVCGPDGAEPRRGVTPRYCAASKALATAMK